MAHISGGYGRCITMKLSSCREKDNRFFRLSRLRAAEIFLVFFLLVYIVGILRMGTSRDVEISVISEEITSQCELNGMETGNAGTLKRYFSLDESIYAGYMLYTSENLMNVDELLIVKVTETGQFDALEDAVDERLKNQIQNFHGYGTNQEELLQNAVVTERGNYFFYAVSEHAEQWEDVFLSCIQ